MPDLSSLPLSAGLALRVRGVGYRVRLGRLKRKGLRVLRYVRVCPRVLEIAPRLLTATMATITYMGHSQ